MPLLSTNLLYARRRSRQNVIAFLALSLRATTQPVDPFFDVVAEVLRQCIDPGYRDRIEPLMRILHPYAKALVEVEQRGVGK